MLREIRRILPPMPPDLPTPLAKDLAARIEAEPKGPGIGHVVTNIAGGSAERLYETMYCARGQLGNFIKLHRLHKNQLLSDRTRCRSPTRYGSCCALPPTGFC